LISPSTLEILTYENPFKIWGKLSFYDKLKLFSRLLGIFISFLCLIFNFFYFSSAIFTNTTLYRGFQAFMLLRVILIMIHWWYLFYKNFWKYQVQIPNEATSRPEIVDYRRSELKDQGITYYIGMPLMMWFGAYRMYSSKDYMRFLILQYCIELFFSGLPLALITVVTNNMNVYMDP